MATTHTLTADTLASAISYAAGDTINLGGFRLSYDTDKSSTSVILAGAGILHMKAGGGILVGGAVPATISVETDHLPVRGSLEFATAAVIKFSGWNYLRDIKSWNCPTDGREGNLWAKITSYDSSTQEVILDRDIPSLAAGDYVSTINGGSGNTDFNTILLPVAGIVHIGSSARIVIGGAAPAASFFSVGVVVCVASCPLCIHNAGSGSNNGYMLSGEWRGGDVLVTCDTYGGFNWNMFALTNGTFRARRICLLPNYSASFNGRTTLATISGMVVADSVFALTLNANQSQNDSACSVSVSLAVVKCAFMGTSANMYYYEGNYRIGRLVHMFASDVITINAGKPLVIGELEGPALTAVPYRNSEIVAGNATLTSGGTATLVSRSSFPRDTDMADAYYFAPATASDEAWRTDTYHVRRGETLRLSIRAMRAADGASLSVDVADDFRSNVATWTLDSNAATLEWQSGHLEWTNTSDRDCEVTVKSSGTGDTNGGYLRVWRATGGAM